MNRRVEHTSTKQEARLFRSVVRFDCTFRTKPHVDFTIKFGRCVHSGTLVSQHYAVLLFGPSSDSVHIPISRPSTVDE